MFNTVCFLDFKIACLAEVWLNESRTSQHFSSEICVVYRSDTDSRNKLLGGKAPPAVSEAVFGINLISYLEYFEEYVSLEITLINGHSLLANIVSSLILGLILITNYFNFLKSKRDSLNCSLLLLEDSIIHDLDWNCGLTSSNFHFCIKWKSCASIHRLLLLFKPT